MSSRKGVMGMNNMDNYMEQMAVLCENNDSMITNLTLSLLKERYMTASTKFSTSIGSQRK